MQEALCQFCWISSLFLQQFSIQVLLVSPTFFFSWEEYTCGLSKDHIPLQMDGNWASSANTQVETLILGMHGSSYGAEEIE